MVRQEKIESLLRSTLQVSYLEVLNESHMHSVPPNSETHFKLTLASDDFEDVSKVQRHQKVYGALGTLLQEGLHAVALHTYTEAEWQQVQKSSPDSPNCMGGSKGT